MDLIKDMGAKLIILDRHIRYVSAEKMTKREENSADLRSTMCHI